MARCHPRAPKVVVSCGKVCEGPLHLWKEKSKSLWSEKNSWKRLILELALGGQLKLHQRRRRDHGWWFWTSANKSSRQSFGLPSCVLAIQIAWVINCLYLFYRLHAYIVISLVNSLQLILYAILSSSKLVLNSSGTHQSFPQVSVLRKPECPVCQTGLSGFGV